MIWAVSVLHKRVIRDLFRWKLEKLLLIVPTNHPVMKNEIFIDISNQVITPDKQTLTGRRMASELYANVPVFNTMSWWNEFCHLIKKKSQPHDYCPHDSSPSRMGVTISESFPIFRMYRFSQWLPLSSTNRMWRSGDRWQPPEVNLRVMRAPLTFTLSPEHVMICWRGAQGSNQESIPKYLESVYCWRVMKHQQTTT